MRARSFLAAALCFAQIVTPRASAEPGSGIKFGAELEFRDVAPHRISRALSALVLTFGAAAPLLVDGVLVTGLVVAASVATSYFTYVGGLNVLHDRYSLPKLREAFDGQEGLRVSAQTPRGIKLRYPDDFWVKFLTDPAVIEATHQPLTTQELRQRLDQFQHDVFDLPARQGVHPSRLGNVFGATHLNIDLESAFRGDALLLRNFLVDFANHSEIASGVLNYDTRNAPALNRDFERREVFARVIAEFDAGEIRTVDELLHAVHHRVYVFTRKNAALSLVNAQPGQPSQKRRIEIRAMRPIRNAADLLKMFELYEARIQYLRTLSTPIPYANISAITGAEEGAVAFQRYLKEAGKTWDDYALLLPARYRAFRFDERGEITKRPSVFKACAHALGSLARF